MASELLPQRPHPVRGPWDDADSPMTKRRRRGPHRAAVVLVFVALLTTAGMYVVESHRLQCIAGSGSTVHNVASLDRIVAGIDSVGPSRVLSFDGDRGSPPSSTEWSFRVGGDGWGNDELQTYTDRRRNSALDGKGNLEITAIDETLVGPDGIKRKYTSARLTTEGKVEVPAGSYVEARIRPAVGEGVWPAFWLMGANLDQVGWPAAGELDILEVFGGDTDTATNYIHMSALDNPRRDRPYGGGEMGGKTTLDHHLDTEFHRYGVYFDSDIVVFYIDGERTMSMTAAQARQTGRAWPFGDPMMVIVNLAVGGLGGHPGETTFPRVMTVGPISVWSDLPPAARPCLTD